MHQNLRSLSLYMDLEPADDTPIRLPRLESLELDDCYGFGCHLIAELITAHRATLRLVFLNEVNLSPTFNTSKTEPWLQLLDAASTLHPEAIRKISDPGSRITSVTFTPSVKDFDPDSSPVEVFRDEKNGPQELHFSTKPGELQHAGLSGLRDPQLRRAHD